MRSFYTITPADVGKPTHYIHGRRWAVTSWIGRVLPLDVGKRVYLVGDCLQVENNEQRDARLARESGVTHRDLPLALAVALAIVAALVYVARH